MLFASCRRILLVDDNPLDVELTLEALRDSGCGNEIDVAHDGADAIDYIYRQGAHAHRSSEDPAVILLDVKMPKIDGLEVLRRLKSDSGKSHIPVVMLTSSREEADLSRSYALGVNAYVVKPVAVGDFLDGVRQLGLFWGIINEVPVFRPPG